MNRGVHGIPTLTRRSSADPQPPGGILPAGGWVEMCGNQNGSASSTKDNEYITRFDLWWPHRIHYLGVAQTTAGSDTARHYLGIRPLQWDGWPGPLLVESVGDATVGTGSKWLPIGVDLPAGRYCLCWLINGWTTTAPAYRNANFGAGDQYSYAFGMPHGRMFPVPASTGLPGAGNGGQFAAQRATTANSGLTKFAARDWSAGGQNMPAIYVQAEPL